MKSEYSLFDRRIEILYILMNREKVTRTELAQVFSVSTATIGRDIMDLSRVAPICTEQGKYGGARV